MRRVLDEFCQNDIGVVTSFSDATLRVLRRWLPDDTGVRVLPMGDLVSKALGMCGTIGPRVATPGQTLAAIREACNALALEGRLGACDRHWGLHESFARALRELRHYGVGDQDLITAADHAPSEAASRRLRLLGDLAARVDGILIQSNREPGSGRIGWLLEQEPVSLGHEGPILVFRGDQDNPLQEQFLHWLARGGTDVIMSVPTLGSERELFHSSHRFNISPQAHEEWWSALFAEGAAHAPIEAQIWEVPDPLFEVEWALRQIQGLLMRDVMPTSIGLYVPNMQDYGPLISHVATRFGMLVSTPFTVSILSNSLAHLLVSLIDAITKHDPGGVARLVRSSYWGLPLDDVVWVREQVTEARRAVAESAWERLAAVSIPAETPGQKWLRFITELRTKWLDGQQSLWQWTEQVRELTQVEWIARGVLEERTSERDLRAHRAMLRTLEEHASMYGRAEESVLGVRQFAALLRELWERGVTVEPGHAGSSFQLIDSPDRLDQFEHLFVLGMLEGAIPKRRSEDPVFFDDDRVFLSEHLKLAVPLPTSFDVARAERDRFVRICAAAGQSVTFMVPLSDGDRDNIPAFYLEEIKRVCPGAKSVSKSRRDIVPWEDLTNPADGTLAKALKEPPNAVVSEGLSEVARVGIAPKPGSEVPINLVVESRRCPFRAAGEKLALYPSLRRQSGTRLDRLFDDAQVALARDPEQARGEWDAALQRLLERSAADLGAWEARLIESMSNRSVSDWLDREFASRESFPKERNSGRMQVSLPWKSKVGEFTITDVVSNRAEYLGWPMIQVVQRGCSLHFEDHQWLRYGFLGVLLAKETNVRKTLVEVDDPQRRVRYRITCTFQNSPASPPGAETDLVKCQALHTDVGVVNLLESLRDEIGEGLRILASGEVRPRPHQETCRNCTWAELCRRSHYFGEVTVESD